MMKFDKNLKIFLTFLIIYSLFVHWVGWNEETRYLLSKAIFFENRFEIDTYYNLTGDRAFFNGHYYSDKAPGIAFITSFLHILGNGSEGTIFIPYKLNQAVIFTPAYLESIELIKRLLFIILTSSVFGAFILLLYAKVFSGRKNILFLIVLFGFSSQLLPYSTTLPGPIFSAFLLLLSCILILRYQKPFLSGLLAGMAPLFEYLSIFFLPSSLILFYNKKEKLIKFIQGVILGLLPTFVYNYTIFGNPFNFPFLFVDRTIWSGAQINYKNWPTNILELLVLPYRGLFFYYPFLVFAIFSIKALIKDKKLRNFGLFLIFLFSSLTFFSAVFLYTTSGSSFSTRYLVVSIPFLLLSFLFVFQRVFRNKIIFSIFIFLNLLSVIFNFSSFSTAWEGPTYILKDKELLDVPSYTNPLFEYYLPSFLENGPRSRIFEYLLTKEIPDIRDFKSIPSREIKLVSTPFGFITINIPFLTVFFLLLILVIVWNKELSNYKLGRISLKWLMIFVAIVFFLSRFEIKDIVFGKGWLPQEINEAARWMSNSSEIYIFSPIDKNVILNISLINYRGKTLELYMNENLINAYISPESVVEIVKLKKGENKLLFKSREGCEIPLYAENQFGCSNLVECMKMNISAFNVSFDVRCLSFGIVNISIIHIDTLLTNLTKNVSIFYGSGFYPQEKYGRWMSNNSVLYIYFPQTRIAFLNISFDGYQNVNVSVFLNNNFIGRFSAQTLFEKVVLKNGINELKFISDSCIVPAYISNGSNDYRCLTKVLRNITIVYEDDLKPGIYFGSNWYDDYWMSMNASFYIYSDKYENVFLNVSFSTYKNITFVLLLNKKKIGEFQGYRVFEPIELNKGLNRITIISNDCYIPAFEEKNSSDLRCLSLAVKNISLIDMDKIRKPEVYFGSGWYDEEKYGGRWASKKSTLYIYSDEKKTVFFNISVPHYRAENIRLILNNQSLGDFKVQSLFVPLTLKKGLNKLELYSDKCEIPAYLENNSKDFRCLSFFVRNISLIDLDELKEIIYFGSGWYEKEEVGRWMSSSSMIYLIRQMNYTKLSLELESFRQPRKLYIEVDGKSYVFNIPAEKSQKISLILSPTNITKIKLETYPACEVPGKNDNRCLSLFLRKLSLENLKNIEYFNFFDEEKYNEIKFRWFSTNSKVYVLSNETNLFLIKFNVWTLPAQKRILKIYVNGMKINEYNVNETIASIHLPVVLRKGVNEIVFLVDACGYVAKDIRCLGVAISEIQKEEINIKNIEKISKGFYGIESAYGSYFRWMSNEGEISLFSSQNSSVKLYAKVGWTYFSDRNLNIKLDDKLIFSEKIAKSGMEFPIILDLVEGWNKIKFTSSCDVPASLEFSEDKRCLSLAFTSLSFLPSSS